MSAELKLRSRFSSGWLSAMVSSAPRAAKSRQRLLIATGGDDPRCTQIFRDLDSLFPGDPGGPVDQDRFAGLELRPAEQGAPGREPWISECGSYCIVDIGSSGMVRA